MTSRGHVEQRSDQHRRPFHRPQARDCPASLPRAAGHCRRSEAEVGRRACSCDPRARGAPARDALGAAARRMALDRLTRRPFDRLGQLRHPRRVPRNASDDLHHDRARDATGPRMEARPPRQWLRAEKGSTGPNCRDQHGRRRHRVPRLVPLDSGAGARHRATRRLIARALRHRPMGMLDYYRQFEDMEESEVNAALRERRAKEKALALEHVPVLDISGTEWPDLPNADVVGASVYRARGRLNGYPDHLATAVKRMLAERHYIRGEQIAFGNGAADLLRTAAYLLAERGSDLICPWPSYELYPSIAARA